MTTVKEEFKMNPPTSAWEKLETELSTKAQKKSFFELIFFWFKKIFTKQNCCKCIIIFSLAFAKANAQTDTSAISKTSIRKIPSVAVKDLYGNTINTASFSNDENPILIVFWYSVHKFSAKELDAIEENYSDWKKETGVKVIVISIDDSRTLTNVLPMVNARGWDFDFYLDINSDFKRAMNVNLVPATFLINGAGKVIWNSVGFMEGSESVIYDELKKSKKP